MGTHCAMKVVKTDGFSFTAERTLDGGLLIDEMTKFIKSPIIPNSHPSVELIGNGATEFDDDREHEECFAAVIDHTTKTIGITYLPIENEVITNLADRIKEGWTFKYTEEV